MQLRPGRHDEEIKSAEANSNPADVNSNHADANNNSAAAELNRSVPPTLLRIYADNQDKRSLCTFWTVFFVLVVLMSGLFFALPDAFLEIDNKSELKGTELEGCENPASWKDGELRCSGNETKNIGTIVLGLGNMNQFAIIYLDVYFHSPKNRQQIVFTADIKQFSITSDHRSDDQIYFRQVQQISNQSKQITLHRREAVPIRAQDQQTILGYTYPVWMIRKLEGNFIVLMEPRKDLKSFEGVASIKTSAITVNPEFTMFTIVIRYFFFVFSAAGCLLYVLRYLKIPQVERLIEQKLVLVLSILLVFFNDPIYTATVLTGNRFSAFLSVTFVVNFVCFLMGFWIVFVDRIFFEDGQKVSSLLYWKRILFVFVLYVLTLVLYAQYTLDQLQNTSIVPLQDLLEGKFLVMGIIVLILAGVGFIYIFVQLARSFTRIDQKLWRSQLYLMFSLFFMLVTLVMFFLNGFFIFSTSGSRILCLYTTMNMFTFYMQYMYSITSEEKEKIEKGQLNSIPHNDFGFLSPEADYNLEFDDLPLGRYRQYRDQDLSGDKYGDQEFNENTCTQDKIVLDSPKGERQGKQEQKARTGPHEKGEARRQEGGKDDQFGDFDLE